MRHNLRRFLLGWPIALTIFATLPASASNATLSAGLSTRNMKSTMSTISDAAAGVNLDSSHVPRLSNAVSQIRTGVFSTSASTRYLIGFIGDSTTAGTRGSANVKSTSYVSRWVGLAKSHAPIDENSFWGSNGARSTSVYDPRIRLGAGITTAGTEPSIGGNGFSMAAALGPFVFSPTEAWDSCDIGLTAGSAGGTVGVQIDSGSVQLVVGPVSNISTYTLTAPLGIHTISITQVRGAQAVQFMSCRNTTKPKLMVGNMGKAGWETKDWVRVNSVGPARSPFRAIYAQRPLALFINLGINDWSNGASVVSYKANIQAMIDYYKPKIDMILMVPFPSNATLFQSQRQYVAALYELAISNDLPLIDTSYPLLGSWEAGSSMYVDNRHPSAVGYQQVADFLDKVMRQLIGRNDVFDYSHQRLALAA